jgi:hypothetical protein
MDEIKQFLLQNAFEGRDFIKLKPHLKEISRGSYITRKLFRGCLEASWNQKAEELWRGAVERQFGNLSEVLCSVGYVLDFGEYFNFDYNDSSLEPGVARLRMLHALYGVVNNEAIPFVEKSSRLPFSLFKYETLIWLFDNVRYYERQPHHKYVGGSHGVSARVAKGLTYRTSRYSGERKTSYKTAPVDNGFLGITQHHVYFSGNNKKFRVALRKIVAIDRFADGISIQRDAQSAVPQIFVTGEGEFTCALVDLLLERALR